MKSEGVTKFNLKFTKTQPIDENIIKDINSWRKILYDLGLIGRDPNKYDGAGYGNISKRIVPYKFTPNKRRFVVTGTQTGGLEELTPENYSTVLEYNAESNFIISEGPIQPSSESISHGTIYNRDSSARYVFHIHSQDIWRNSEKLEIPKTKDSAEYGTPEMAREILRLFKDKNLTHRKILSMGGHEDGIIAFGRTSDEAGLILIRNYVKALELKI